MIKKGKEKKIYVKKPFYKIRNSPDMPTRSQSPRSIHNSYSLHNTKMRNYNTRKNTSPNNNTYPHRALSEPEINQVKKTPIGRRLLNLTKRIFNKKTLIAILITGALLYELRKKGHLGNKNPLTTKQQEDVRVGVAKTVTNTLSKNNEINSKTKQQIKENIANVVTSERINKARQEPIFRPNSKPNATKIKNVQQSRNQNDFPPKRPGRIRRIAGKIGKGTKNFLGRVIKPGDNTIQSSWDNNLDNTWYTQTKRINSPKNSSIKNETRRGTKDVSSHSINTKTMEDILRENALESLADNPKKSKSPNSSNKQRNYKEFSPSRDNVSSKNKNSRSLVGTAEYHYDIKNKNRRTWANNVQDELKPL